MSENLTKQSLVSEFVSAAGGANLSQVLRSHLSKYAGFLETQIDELGHAEQFSWDKLVAFRTQELDRGQSPNSINSNLTSLRRFLRFLCSKGVLSDHQLNELMAIENVAMKRGSTFREKPRFDIDASLLLCGDDTLAGLRDAALLGLMFIAGLNRAQICRAELSDFSGVCSELKVKAKNGLYKRVEVPEQARDLLTTYLIEFRGGEPGPLFLSLNRNGDPRPGMKPLSPAAVNLVIEKRCVVAGS